ncbi:MAG: GNAT family N-acetyltransferase [Lactobacillales bacterium]|jgi:GNAT superfamily N-acetyltransferase|nr:GNAT family N-acetyltransferase [Lactobacillales bacterium]
MRKAKITDVPSITEIIEGAKLTLREIGSPQWQADYPNEETILDDIERGYGWVEERDGQVVAYLAAVTDGDPNYYFIEGHWLPSDWKYTAIHRVAIHRDYLGQGVASTMFDALDFGELRIDTHALNLPMRRLIEKSGFSYRGVIYVADGTPRMAYQKI